MSRQKGDEKEKQTDALESVERSKVDHPSEDVSSNGETVLQGFIVVLIDDLRSVLSDRAKRVLVELEIVVVDRVPRDPGVGRGDGS